MKLRSFFIGLFSTVIFLIIGLFAAETQTVQADPSSSINAAAKQNKYVGTTYLYKILAQQNITYNKFYEKNKITYRNGKPEGIVIHETATPGASAYNEAIYFNREWDSMYAYVHAFVDANQVIQMMTPDYGVWGAGPIANERFVQVELCEVDNSADFAKSVNNDAIWCAQILRRYKLTPSNACIDGKGTIWSHAAVSKFLGGTDHGDPDAYFEKWGYSMDQFVDLVKYYYNRQARSSASESKPNPAKNIVNIPKNKKGNAILMHDAYVYTAKAKKIKNKKILAGTSVKIANSKMINKKKYYEVGKNQYINAANVDGKLRTVKQTSYVYNASGISNGKTKLTKDSQVRTYGATIGIQGVKYYQISPTQFVKAENF